METQYVEYIAGRINGTVEITPNKHNAKFASVHAVLRDADKTDIAFIYPVEKLLSFDAGVADELVYRIKTA